MIVSERSRVYFKKAAWCAVFFFILSWYRRSHFVIVLDQIFYQQAEVLSKSPYWILFWEGISLLGNGFFVYPVFFSLILILKNRMSQVTRQDLFFFLFAVVFFCSNIVLKLIFQLPRPESLSPYTHLLSYSFPSGHSVNAVVLCLLLPQILKNCFHIDLYQKKFFKMGSRLLIVFIGLSRIFLGAHWLSDVVGGIVWGCVGTYLLLGTRKSV